MNFPATIREFKSFSSRYSQAYSKVVEEGGNGAALSQTLQSEIMGIIPIKPKESKDTRLADVSALFEAGNVYLPDPSIAPWVGDNIEELCNFPFGRHDDTVDASVYALNRFKDTLTSFEPLKALSVW